MRSSSWRHRAKLARLSAPHAAAAHNLIDRLRALTSRSVTWPRVTFQTRFVRNRLHGRRLYRNRCQRASVCRDLLRRVYVVYQYSFQRWYLKNIFRERAGEGYLVSASLKKSPSAFSAICLFLQVAVTRSQIKHRINRLMGYVAYHSVRIITIFVLVLMARHQLRYNNNNNNTWRTRMEKAYNAAPVYYIPLINDCRAWNPISLRILIIKWGCLNRRRTWFVYRMFLGNLWTSWE